ncbi:SPP1 family predicted phage head-tail adaptor [Hoeflea marina]|uniref:SPP1 family predicted phage head-tail adaptor n=1 Tax=Hoeflea marina TaxID=274592 RepID=A0A317PNR1_9HYPH|nr:phage head closure protein [Hoeflea marina]PWW02213.1 SPP1 family predicted phage head-tail adaptor [Hoeflea marina]
MGWTTLDPGRLTARLVLEAPDDLDDGQGGAVPGWATVASLWGLVEPLAVRPGEEANAFIATATHRVTIRFRNGVASGMRFGLGARRLAIRTLRDPDEGRRYLVCDCEEEGR